EGEPLLPAFESSAIVPTGNSASRPCRLLYYTAVSAAYLNANAGPNQRARRQPSDPPHAHRTSIMSSGPKTGFPEGWEIRHSNSKNVPYCFHPASKDSRWEPPAGIDPDRLKAYMAKSIQQ
ncbi:peptidyl-prolyl cis-trans isomerase ssp-1, partial [Paraphaeosphaeria minitans]